MSFHVLPFDVADLAFEVFRFAFGVISFCGAFNFCEVDVFANIGGDFLSTVFVVFVVRVVVGLLLVTLLLFGLLTNKFGRVFHHRPNAIYLSADFPHRADERPDDEY